MFHPIEEAIIALQNGEMIIVVDDENRENEGDLVALADLATPEIINFMATHGKGLICTPISLRLANHLQLAPMVHNNTDFHQTAFTVSIDHIETQTGISAFERSLTIQKLVEENATAADFRRPGHVFPLIAKDGGVLERRGHTEAAIDLAKLCGASEAGVICEILKENGQMARVPDLILLSKKWAMKLITIEALSKYIEQQQLKTVGGR